MKPTARHTQLDRAYPIQFLDKPEELLEKEKEIISHIRRISGMTKEEWQAMTLPALLNLAEFVQLLPASADHHHSEEGGLFRHSLETGLFALQKARKITLSRSAANIGQINNARTYWNHAALLGGLFHDLGKTICNFAVFKDDDYSIIWEPLNESLWEWGLRNGVKNYKVMSLLSNEFADKEDPLGNKVSKETLKSALKTDAHEIFSSHLAVKLLPKAYRIWFQNIRNENIQKFLILSLAPHPNESEDTLRQCIQEADRKSTSNYVKNNIDFPASETPQNIVSAFFKGVTYALDNDFWKVNQPDAEVFVIEDKCFIDWNRITLNNLAAFLEKNDQNSGFIREREKLAQWLIDNGLAHVNRKLTPEGKPIDLAYYTIQPHFSNTATRAVWLTKSPFRGLVPSISGSIQECTDVVDEDADDIYQTDEFDDLLNESDVSLAQKIRESRETENFNKSRSSTTEKFDAEKEAKVKDLNKSRRAMAGRIRRIKTAKSVVDSVFRWFGYVRIVEEEDAVVVKETPVDNDLPVRREKGAGSYTQGQPDVIIQGVSEEFATKKIEYNREKYLNSHPELLSSEPLIHYGEDWKSLKKFPKLPRFTDSEFIEKNSKQDTASVFTSFKSKKTNRFMWRYYPFAVKLAAFTSKERFETVSFTDEEQDIALREKLTAFFKDELVPSEINPSPELVRVPKVDDEGVVSTDDEEELQVRTPEIEKNADIIARYVNYYRKALESFKIGRGAGCFPSEFKNSEFYPFFIELAAVYLNNERCRPDDSTAPVPLVEVNKRSVRVNGWMLLNARFRSVCRVTPQCDEDDPAYLLSVRVEKFLKPTIQIFSGSFRKEQKEQNPTSKEKEAPIPTEFSVTFTDDLTVAAVNFLVREHKVSRYQADEEALFRNLFAITGKGKSQEAAKQDLRFGREGMERFTPAGAEQEKTGSQENLEKPEKPENLKDAGQKTSESQNTGDKNSSTVSSAENNTHTNSGEQPGAEADNRKNNLESGGIPSGTQSRDGGEREKIEKGSEDTEQETGDNKGSNSADRENNGSPVSSRVNDTVADSDKKGDEQEGNTPQSDPESDSKSDQKSSSIIESNEGDESNESDIGGAEASMDKKIREFLQTLGDEMRAGGGTLIVADDITFTNKKDRNIYCITLEKFKELTVKAGLNFQETLCALTKGGQNFFLQGGKTIGLSVKNNPKQGSFWQP